MAANSRDVEAVVRDRCFFMDFDFVVMKGSRRNNLPSSPFLSLIVQISSPYLTPFTSYIQAPIVYFPYTNQSVLLLLCRTVTSKAFRIRSWNFDSIHIWVCRLQKCNKMEFENVLLCLVFADPVTIPISSPCRVFY